LIIANFKSKFLPPIDFPYNHTKSPIGTSLSGSPGLSPYGRGYFLASYRFSHSAIKSLSSPDKTEAVQLLRPCTQKAPKGAFCFARSTGLEPATSRVHLSTIFIMAWTISSPYIRST